MKSYCSDPTANIAIGRVDRELKKMRKDAEYLKVLRREGRLSYEAESHARAKYIGIYRHIWEEVMEI